MIKNIIFDIGDVIVEYDPEKYIKEIGMMGIQFIEEMILKDKIGGILN